LKDTKEVIRIHKSKKDRQHNGQKDKEELEDTKEVIRIHKSKNDRQHNGQKDKEELEDIKEVIRIIFQLFFVLLAIVLCVLL
jgi:uncharacterized protein YgfB (UPF0149 family)